MPGIAELDSAELAEAERQVPRRLSRARPPPRLLRGSEGPWTQLAAGTPYARSEFRRDLYDDEEWEGPAAARRAGASSCPGAVWCEPCAARPADIADLFEEAGGGPIVRETLEEYDVVCPRQARVDRLRRAIYRRQVPRPPSPPSICACPLL